MTDRRDDGGDPISPSSGPENASEAADATNPSTMAGEPVGAVEPDAPVTDAAGGPAVAEAGTREPAPGEPEPVEAAPGEPATADPTTTDEPTSAMGEAPQADPVPDDTTAPAAEPATEPADEPAGEVTSGAETSAGPSEQIEWQPVVSGDQIEWQPVVHGESEVAWSDDAYASMEREGDAAWADPSYAYPGEQPASPPVDYYGDEYAEPATGWDPAAVPAPGNGSGTPARPPVAPARRSGAVPPTPPPGAAGGTPPGDGSRAKAKRQVIILSVLSAVVLLVLVLGFVLSRGAAERGREALPPPTSSASIVTVPPADLVTFRDDQTGFTIKHPKTWRSLGAPLSDIRLTLDAGGNDGLRIRLHPIQTPATTENIANLKAVTDTIVFGDPSSGRRLIQEQLVTLNGLLTYYYIYTFTDPISSQEGVHVTYFVFEGHRMFQMTFQAVPAEDFRQLAGIFDQVAESFTVTPEARLPSTTVPPTSAPPTTSG